MASVSYGSLPFQQQIDFFRRKLKVPTDHYTDLRGSEHDIGFMVAGANRNGVLSDLHYAVNDFITNGRTLADFRKDFDSIVADRGWDYNGTRNHRTATIYKTNLYQSYNAGRYEQLQAQKSVLPYWRYRHSRLATEPRKEHLAWDGMVLRADDPWWHTHAPQNGYGCECYIEALTEDDLNDLGMSGPDTAPPIEYETRVIGQRSADGPFEVQVPKGIDPGFDHMPGRSRIEGMVPSERPVPPIAGSTGGPGFQNRRATDALPPPRAIDIPLLPVGLSEIDYATAFLAPFGATLERSVIYKDVTGEPLAIGAALFKTKRTGELKANKNGRGQYMPILARGVIDPDEIWVRMEYHEALKKSVMRRRYIARFALPESEVPALAVWEWSESGWSGVTVFKSEQDINQMRVGVRVYKR